jgi:hypothetical protein
MPFTVSDDGIGCLICGGSPTTGGTLEQIRPVVRAPNGNRVVIRAVTIVTAGAVTEFLIGFGGIVRFRSGALLNGVALAIADIWIEQPLDQPLQATLLNGAATVTANLFYTPES